MKAREWQDPRVLAVIVAMTGSALLEAFATYVEATDRERAPPQGQRAPTVACSDLREQPGNAD